MIGLLATGLPWPSSSVKISWKVDNPDHDELRYRVSYRLEGQTTWRNMLKPGEKLIVSGIQKIGDGAPIAAEEQQTQATGGQ